MRKFLMLGMICVLPMISGVAHANDLGRDTSDPLFMLGTNGVLSETAVTYSEEVLRLGQTLTYGLHDRLSVGANVHYQLDFDGHEDGFSSIDLGAIYRMANASDNNDHIISDVLFGLKFGGSSHVRTPWFADSTYYVGLRFGRQWAGMTLATTIKSSWIFDETRGMAYIDFIPESYFRISPDWRLGGGLTFRKATNPDYNQEWLNMRAVRQYGRTQYAGHFDYEFEHEQVQVGLTVNILF